MRAQLRRMGNSSGLIIPKPVLDHLGVTVGDNLEIALEEGRLIIVPAKEHPRAGWAEAAQEIAEAGEDALVWPEFSNAADADLRW